MYNICLVNSIYDKQYIAYAIYCIRSEINVIYG